MAMSNSEPSIAIDCGRRGYTATTTMKQPSAEANGASNKPR